MAAYISFQPSDHYNTVLYTGTGASNAVTGVGFSPNMTWLKSRSAATSQYVFDTVRGATYGIFPDGDWEQAANAQYLNAFGADGFTVGTNTAINDNAETYASWNWNAATTTGLSGGTITPSSYSINADAGIGIYKYAGTGSNGTIAHGLGAGNKFLWVKNTSSGGGVNWKCIHSNLASSVENVYLNLNSAEYGEAATFNSTFPGDTVFNLGTNSGTNASGNDYIAYLFCSKRGFSKMGSYVGNNNANGTFVYTGFRPAVIIIKDRTAGNNWAMFDNKRIGYNVKNYTLYPNDVLVESTTDQMDILSNGFKCRIAHSGINGNGNTYVYAAFAEFPFVSSNSKPGTAR